METHLNDTGAYNSVRARVREGRNEADEDRIKNTTQQEDEKEKRKSRGTDIE